MDPSQKIQYNFWTVGPILVTQKAELVKFWIPVHLFYISPSNYAAYGSKNDYSMIKIGEKKFFHQNQRKRL